jgi:outer membrane usher protein
MRALSLLLLLAAPLLGPCQSLAATELPPPPGQAAPLAGITLYLELVVNQHATGQIVPVLLKDGSFLIDAQTLRGLHVQTPYSEGQLVAVDRLEGVTVRYDSVAQRLELMLPPSWLPGQQLGSDRPFSRLTPLVGQGFVMNYELYASNPGRRFASTSLWSEQRWFGAWGLLSNSGVARRSSGSGLAAEQGYVRYDTSYRYADTDAVRTLTVGDLITATLPWGSAVRIGGVQLARNFAIRPDLVRYPVPRFSGQAAVPSAVDLFINGQRAGREEVQPGPFTFNTMPFITGAGEAVVVTTDALGRQVLTTVPFYVSSTLLKTGTTDYALSAGALRRRYGEDSFGYGRAVASASYRYGLSDTVALEARSELARGLALGGAGAVVALGHYGVANVALAHGGEGHQWTAGYQYNSQRFGLTLQHTQRTPGWRDLAALDRGPLTPSDRRSTLASASVSLDTYGALSAAYVDALARDGERTRVATVSYSRAVGSQSFVSVNFNRAIGTRDYVVQLQWTLMLGDNGAVSLVGTRDRRGLSRQLQYNRNVPSSGGLGWNLAYANSDRSEDYRQGSLTWRGDYLQLQGGAYAQGSRNATWAGASGSLVAMDGGWFAANRINDAFALVATGVPDVPIRFENQLIGSTNARGHLLVPSVNAYYPTRFEIDVLGLPDYMQAEQTEQRVLLGAGTGALLRFDIQTVRAASVTLVDLQGKPLPVGLRVQHQPSGRSATLGWDGQVYLEGLADDNELIVSGADVQSCRVRFHLANTTPGVARVGPLTCQPTPLPLLTLRHAMP